jgi:hypothetical protein
VADLHLPEVGAVNQVIVEELTLQLDKLQHQKGLVGTPQQLCHLTGDKDRETTEEYFGELFF